jgi:Transposase IS4
MLHLEIQKGKEPMREAQFWKEYGCTTACALRLLQGSEGIGQKTAMKEKFIADSWFASVKLAERVAELGHEFTGPVKTNTSGFPGKEIGKIMEHWPAGSSIVFDAEDISGRKLGLKAVGYKYRKKSSIQFIMTSDAGSTTDGIC